jgi:uncharacterized protein (DUF2336 family)
MSLMMPAVTVGTQHNQILWRHESELRIRAVMYMERRGRWTQRALMMRPLQRQTLSARCGDSLDTAACAAPQWRALHPRSAVRHRRSIP